MEVETSSETVEMIFQFILIGLFFLVAIFSAITNYSFKKCKDAMDEMTAHCKDSVIKSHEAHLAAWKLLEDIGELNELYKSRLDQYEKKDYDNV